MACQLLASLIGPGLTETKVFAAALKNTNGGLNTHILEVVAASRGGEYLRGEAMVRLALVLDLEEECQKVQELGAALSTGAGGKGRGGEAGDPFDGLPEEALDAEELERGYGEATQDVVHTQVGSVDLFLAYPC